MDKKNTEFWLAVLMSICMVCNLYKLIAWIDMCIEHNVEKLNQMAEGDNWNSGDHG